MGGFKPGGFLIWTCPSFFVLFWDFPDFLGFSRFVPGLSGDFPDLSFSSLGLLTAPGGLPREGVVAKKFMPSLESLSSLGFEARNLGRPGNFAGMSLTPGGVQKVCGKKVCARFSFPSKDCLMVSSGEVSEKARRQ